MSEIVEQTVEQLQARVKELEEAQKGMVPMCLTYQSYIDGPPMSKEQLYGQSCSSDTVTVNSWRDKWLKHIKANAAAFDFKAQSSMAQYGMYAYKPVIVAGSGILTSAGFL